MTLGPFLNIATAACHWALGQPDLAEFAIADMVNGDGVLVTLTWRDRVPLSESSPPSSPSSNRTLVILDRSLLGEYAPPMAAVERLEAAVKEERERVAGSSKGDS